MYILVIIIYIDLCIQVCNVFIFFFYVWDTTDEDF